MNPIHIKAVDIQDAWFQALDAILDHGFDYQIQDGSYVGDKRLEFDHFTALISHPQTRPLEPQIPAAYGLPNPVADGYIDSYIPYLMTADKKPGEEYTYGERMNAGDYIVDLSRTVTEKNVEFFTATIKKINQIELLIERMRDKPNGNQYILQIAQPSDCLLPDPPCLRHIDMRIKDGELIFYPYFRSWDLWGGFPANLGGLVHLQEYMAGQIGVEPGPFFVASKGLHIYKYVWELAELRTQKKMKKETD